MDNNLSEAVNRLPKDWWKTIKWCASCSILFKGYILGLMLSGEIYGKHQTVLYSGFLFEFENTLIWFTAGHVTDQINKILSDNPPKNLKGRWIDWENIPGADSIPVNFKEFHPFSGWDYGRDLGMYILGPLETEIMKKNKHSICFHMEHVTNLQNFQPEGYYLLGFPENLREQTRINQIQVYSSTLVCLPIEKIPFSTDLLFEEPDPNAFHGKIIFFPDSPNSQFMVPGMSGGPVIGIKRNPLKGIDYRLYAIQSKWLSESRLIRAEPILEPIEWIAKIWNSSDAK
jgi:hypothetical protein